MIKYNIIIKKKNKMLLNSDSKKIEDNIKKQYNPKIVNLYKNGVLLNATGAI